MLEPKEIERLEARAGCARNGYALDDNITPYVYARDMIALLNDRREILIELSKWRILAEERERRQPGMPDKVENGLKELPEPEPTPVQEQPRKKVRT